MGVTLIDRPHYMLGSLFQKVKRVVLRAGLETVSSRWPAYSRLMVVDDGAGWVISEESKELISLSKDLGISVKNPRWIPYCTRQSVFFTSQFTLLRGEFPNRGHRVGFAYFHGRPGTGVPSFDEAFAALCRDHVRVHRIQVSHAEMRDVVLESGIDPAKVFLIPIAINLSYFSVQNAQSKQTVRTMLGIPQDAAVVGSFQKDGIGWDDGMEPKLIKGPDVFLSAIGILKRKVPELFVLLSGPARGFVTSGLERLGVRYKHVRLDTYREIARLFHALDLYIVASRQEGGPKAILESMASGIALVTTRVGQAMDLVRHGHNGWMVDVEDAAGLAHWAEYCLSHPTSVRGVLNEARNTAQANSYEAQLPLWAGFMTDFVELPRIPPAPRQSPPDSTSCSNNPGD